MSEINFNAVKCYDAKVSPALYNRLVDIVQAQGLEPGIGYNLSRSTMGTTLRIKQAASAAITPLPFSVSVASISGDPSDVSVSVRPGTANQFVPDNIFDAVTVANTGTFYAKLSIETDGQNITSCSINVDDSVPDQQAATPNALPSSFDILLAIIKDGKPYQTQSGSLSIVGYQTFIVDADPPADPGQLTYTPYFIWQISAV
jgi:hypothetical protein